MEDVTTVGQERSLIKKVKFAHTCIPQYAKKHEKFGMCMDNCCKKLHLSVCRSFLNTQNCKYEENCKFYHPHGLKDFRRGHERNMAYPYQINKPFLDQRQTVQGSFLEMMKSQKEILRRLEQLEVQNHHMKNKQRTW